MIVHKKAAAYVGFLVIDYLEALVKIHVYGAVVVDVDRKLNTLESLAAADIRKLIDSKGGKASAAAVGTQIKLAEEHLFFFGTQGKSGISCDIVAVADEKILIIFLGNLAAHGVVGLEAFHHVVDLLLGNNTRETFMPDAFGKGGKLAKLSVGFNGDKTGH